MLTGREITIEVGGRTLLRDGSFVVGAREKVALVGANGAGKSSLLTFLLGEPPGHLKVSGDVQRVGTIGFLPQVPVPAGLGIDSSVFSHVLSARGLDVLDEELHKARRLLSAEPTDQHIARFSSLEERYRLAGGYEVEGQLGRLADGLGLAQKFLLADIGSLSGGQRRRVDLIRVLFQAPDLMILDEPTNHLDRSAKLWLMDELATLRGSLLLVSHDLKLLDHAIDKVLNLSGSRLSEFKGNYSAFRTQLEADISQREKASSMEGSRIVKMRTQADKWRHSTESQARKAKILDRQVAKLQANRTEVIKRDRKVKFSLPEPMRAGGIVMTVQIGRASCRERVSVPV
jgi:ATPase subunit of ABC transporter with duplicated ATPase domains